MHCNGHLKEVYSIDEEKLMASIIVPAFNCSDYIVNCIDSLINQLTNYSYEIIIIDDGSTDNTQKIIAQHYSNIKNVRYFYINNSGVAAARNYGIRNSIGKYIINVDADDVVSTNYINMLIRESELNNCDLVSSGYEIIYEKTGIQVKNEFKDDVFFEDSLKECLKIYGSDGLLNVAVSKCFRKAIIDKYNLIYNVNLKSGEDLVFNIGYLSHSKRVKFLKGSPYKYIRRDTISGVNSYKNNQFEIVKVCLSEITTIYNKADAYIDLNHLLANYYLDYISAGIYNLYRPEAKLNKNDRIRKINRYYLLDSRKIALNSNRKDILSELSKILIKIDKPFVSDVAYSFLFTLRYNFSKLYIKIRHVFIFKSDM